MSLRNQFKNFFLGNSGGVKQADRFGTEQLQAMNQARGIGLQQLQNPYQGFEPIAQRAQSQFFQNTLPQIGQAFTGTGGALSSPALGLQGQQAGIDLQERLAALQAQYGLQNQQNGLQALSQGLQPQFENFYQQSQPGFLENTFNAGINAIPGFMQARNMKSLLDTFRGSQGGGQGQYQGQGQMQAPNGYSMGGGQGQGYGQGYYQQQNPFMGQGGNFRMNPYFSQQGMQ